MNFVIKSNLFPIRKREIWNVFCRLNQSSCRRNSIPFYKKDNLEPSFLDFFIVFVSYRGISINSHRSASNAQTRSTKRSNVNRRVFLKEIQIWTALFRHNQIQLRLKTPSFMLRKESNCLPLLLWALSQF